MSLKPKASYLRKFLFISSKVATDTVMSLFGKYLYRSNEVFSCLFAQFALVAMFLMPILMWSSRDWPSRAKGDSSIMNLTPPMTILFAYLLPTLLFTGALSAKKLVIQKEGPGIQGLITGFQAPFSGLMQWIYFGVGLAPLSVISVCSSMACYLSSIHFVSDWTFIPLSTVSCAMIVFRNVYTKKHSTELNLDSVQALYVTCLLMMPCLFTTRCLIVAGRSFATSLSLREAIWQVCVDHVSAFTDNFCPLLAFTLLTGWSNLMVFWILENCNPLSLTIANQMDALLVITLDLFGIDVFFLDVIGINSALMNNNRDMTPPVWVGYLFKLIGAACYICDKVFEANRMRQTEKKKKGEELQYKTNQV